MIVRRSYLFQSVFELNKIQKLNYVAASSLPFKIPKPIQRSPTELLEALSETVGIDKLAPNYVFIDDPAMIPTGLNKKKHFFLCKEFGKRAARQLAEEWPTLFMFDRDQPRLSAFRPEKSLDPTVVELNEENLIKMISKKHVEDAVKFYERICTENINVSKKTQIDLYNLVCYYNAKNIPIDEIQEWHALRNFYESDEKKSDSTVSNENSIIDLLFEEIDKNSEIYSARICNLCKFKTNNFIIRAQTLFKEMIDKNFTPSEEVFNYFIENKISTTKKKFDLLDELKIMAQLGIYPSVLTFNAAILSLLTLSDVKNSWDLAKNLLAEMSVLQIKPNLTTYNYLLTLSEKHNKSFSLSVLNSILNKLESSDSIEISQHTDELFFLTAIKIATDFKNSLFIDRIENLYISKKNKIRFSSFITEADFYNFYLIYKLYSLSISEFEDVYIEHIPRIASLNFGLARRIFNRLEKYPKWSFLKRVIEDCICIGHSSNQLMINYWQKHLLNYPVKNFSSNEKNEYIELVNHLIMIWNEINKLNNREGIENKQKQNIIDFTFFESEMIDRGIVKAYK